MQNPVVPSEPRGCHAALAIVRSGRRRRFDRKSADLHLFAKCTVVMNCSIADCGKRVLAKGLCRTHYERLRRTGSALTQRRPGRAKDQERAVVLASFPEWSTRTQAMYWKAFCRLRQLGEMQGSGDKPLQLATQESARSNGSLNVRKFDAMSIHLCAAYIEELTRSSTRNS